MPSTSRFASGVAVVTAAAGLAYKHREKLTALLKRDGGQETGISALPPGTQEPPPSAAGTNNWTSDPAETAATQDAERDAAVPPEAAEEPSPWVSPKPPNEEPQTAAEEPQATTGEPPEAAKEPSPWVSPQPPDEEPSPWVSPHPPNQESQTASPPDPRTQEPPGEER